MTTFDEKYVFTANAKRNIAIVLVIGVLFLVVGIFMNMGDATHEEEEHAANAVSEQLLASTDLVQHASDGEAAAEAEHHETATWLKKLYSNLWINNMFFCWVGTYRGILLCSAICSFGTLVYRIFKGRYGDG